MADTKLFKLWHRIEVSRRITGKSIDQIVDESMAPENLKIEVKEEGRWIVADEIPET